MNRKAEAVREGQVARVVAFERALKQAGLGSGDRLLLKLYTAGEVADLLGVKVGTVRDLTYRRELPFVKIGPRGVRYRLLDILAWIEARSHPV